MSPWIIIACCAVAVVFAVLVLSWILPRGLAVPATVAMAIVGYVIWAQTTNTGIGEGGYLIWTPLVGFAAWCVAKPVGKFLK